MARQADKKKVPWRCHSQAFRGEALALTGKVGVAAAAHDLGSMNRNSMIGAKISARKLAKVRSSNNKPLKLRA